MCYELTARQRREQEFFDDYWRKDQHPTQVNLDPVAGKEHRPWNAYWYVFECVKQRYESGARTLLDFGCGAGYNSLLFATLGYEVSGFDLSPGAVETAESLAANHHLAHRTHFSVQRSENLDYPDQHFDVVVGIDILHHVEIAPSIAETLRVLKPGGVAYFKECVEVHLFDRLVNSAVTRFLFPWFFLQEKTYGTRSVCLTEDERKLTDHDLDVVRELCPTTIEKRFYNLARLHRLFPMGDRSSPLEKFDYWLDNKIPALGKLGGWVLLELDKGSDPSRTPTVREVCL